MSIKGITPQMVDPYKAALDTEASVQGRQRRQAEATPQRQGSQDRISVSTEARLRTEALQTAMGAVEVRQEKVAALREQVASGEYVVDAKQVAQKLLQSDAVLVSTVKE